MSRKQVKRKKQIIDDKDLRFVAYRRKSTEDDKHQMYSVEDQETWILNIAAQYGYNVVADLHEERSAAKPYNRPEFTKMMDMLYSGKANAILCYHTDRLSRNPEESGKLQQALSDGIIQKIHASNGVYLPSSGNLPLALNSCMASQYVSELSTRVTNSMLQNNRRGRCNGWAGAGYKNYRDPDNLKKSIVVKDLDILDGTGECRYTLIQKALKMFGTGKYSPVEIKQMLDEWGFRSRRSKKPITLTGIHYILESPFYCGYTEDPETLEWHKAEWYDIAMITEDEYHRNQIIKSKYKRYKGSKPRICARAKKFQLKGTMICSSCGCGIGGGEHHKTLADGSIKFYNHYACNNNNHNSQNICHLHGGINEEKAFQQIKEMFDSYTINQPLYNWALEIFQSLRDEEIYERNHIEYSQNASIKALKAQRDDLLDTYLNRGKVGGIIMTSEDYNSRREKIDNAIKELEESRVEAQQRSRNWYEIIGKTLETLSNPNKELKSGACDGEYREILQCIGPQAYLDECIGGHYKNGKVFTKRIIKVDPYPWLKKIKKSAEKIEADYSEVFTTNLQGKNDLKSAPYNEWCARLDLNQHSRESGHYHLKVACLPIPPRAHI